MKTQQLPFSDAMAARTGARIAIATVFGYALACMLYTILRSSLRIVSILPNREQGGILWANALALAYSIAVLSILLALVAAVTGAVAAVTLRRVLRYFNPQNNGKKAMLISCGTMLYLLYGMYILLYSVFASRMSFQYPATFIFWYALPAVICLVISIPAGIALNKRLSATAETGIQKPVV